MHPVLEESLASPDLFQTRACHVFLKALFELLSDENFSARRLQQIQENAIFTGIIYEAAHVYCFRNGFAVDSEGIQDEASLVAKWNAKNGQYRYVPLDLDVKEIGLPKLPNMSSNWEIDKFRLCHDPEFLRKAERQAKEAIRLNRDKFRVSKVRSR